jgi:vancomycin resistance protein YoaR
VWTLPVIATCVALIAVGGWWLQSQYAVYSRYLAVRERVAQDTFFPGTMVDGVDLSGKSMGEAQALLGEQAQRQTEQFALTIAYEGHNWRITSQEVPVGVQSDRALRQAYAYGRGGTLQQRYAQVVALAQHGVRLETTLGYDRDRVRELTDEVADRIDQPPQNARLSAFNPTARSFVFEEGKPGLLADREKLYADVTAALDAKIYDAAVQVQTTPTAPTLTQADIAPLYGRVSAFSTTTTDDRNRNNNINLSAQAINGRMLMPGDKLSFNESTGQRTPAKGYLEAGAISGGQLIDETGGGVCQTSSTLFNAVVRADLEILTRTQHAWPSTYVEKGEDAAVDYPRLDFVFRNNQDTPVFIIAWYENRTVTVEVYGKLMPPGRSIDLYSETLKTYKPSDEVIYTRSASLPAGSSKVAKKKRTGYLVDTYKVYYQDGAELQRDRLWRTEYKAIQQEVYFN